MKFAVALVALLFAACASAPEVPVNEVAPKGVLHVAIAVGPSASAFWATRDVASGSARGVTVELGKAAAALLRFLASPESAPVIVKAGLTPIPQ